MRDARSIDSLQRAYRARESQTMDGRARLRVGITASDYFILLAILQYISQRDEF
jgi:hypothetical protein